MGIRGRDRSGAQPGGPGSREGDLGLIGRSPAIRELRRKIQRVAPTDATVLILGERGTGKELVARALVAASRRRERPFIAVNCAALPAELLAAELFGHERGAFTGATDRRQGLLLAAQGGTVFLDEIGDLSLTGQAMLLRFLQEREVRPVGSSSSLCVDVRVIAATNQDLERAVQEKDFRADLHDRLNEVVLEVPSLRERREDIPLLVERFLQLQSRRHGLPMPTCDVGAMQSLMEYRWPGNVRELEKAISRAVIFAEEVGLRVADLDLPIVEKSSAPPDLAHSNDRDGSDLTEHQREILRQAALRGEVRRRDVTQHFRISGEAARRELIALVRLGLLGRSGRRRGCRYFPLK